MGEFANWVILKAKIEKALQNQLGDLGSEKYSVILTNDNEQKWKHHLQIGTTNKEG